MTEKKPAALALENGLVLRGFSVGADGENAKTVHIAEITAAIEFNCLFESHSGLLKASLALLNLTNFLEN